MDKRNKDKRSPMPGGLTREEFEELREDIQQILSEHPLSRFTIVLIDENGESTSNPDRAVRYGMTVHEGDKIIFEEYGAVPAEGAWKPSATERGRP